MEDGGEGLPPPAAALLDAFLRLATELAGAAAPSDNFTSMLAADPRYERALKSVATLARHGAGGVVGALTTWRRNTQEALKQRFSHNGVVNLQGVCKRAAMEILFLEASLQVLEQAAPGWLAADAGLASFYANIQNVVFRWVMNAEEYVPFPDLGGLRQHVVAASVRIIGALSRLRLAELTDVFLSLLTERMAPRKDSGLKADNTGLRVQLLKLAASMKRVSLRWGDDAALAQSLQFLQRAHPLRHTAPVKKSQVHDALCDMLAAVLAPVVLAGGPRVADGLGAELVVGWYTTLQALKSEVWQWMAEAGKHLPERYPCAVTLLCVLDDDAFGRQAEAAVDFLNRQMKSKEQRPLCLRLLLLIIHSHLARRRRAAAAGAAGADEADSGDGPGAPAWLPRCTQPLVASARKGVTSPADMQEAVVRVAALSPGFAVRHLLLDLLSLESVDCQMTALRALHEILTFGEPAPGSALGAVPPRSLQGALDGIRAGRGPWEALRMPGLLPRMQLAAARLLQQLHLSVGGATAHGGGESFVPKDRQPQVALLGCTLRLLPLLRPETWPAGGRHPTELLARRARARPRARAALLLLPPAPLPPPTLFSPQGQLPPCSTPAVARSGSAPKPLTL